MNKFNKSYASFLIGVVFGIVYIAFLFGFAIIFKWNNIEFGTILILVGVFSIYDQYIMKLIESKIKDGNEK